MAATTYHISSAAEFTNTVDEDGVFFNAVGPAGGTGNQIIGFVTTTGGDILYRSGSGTANAVERLAIGTSGQVLTVNGTPIAQVQDITCVADIANSLDGTYFLISSPTVSYYLWISTSGGSATDPGLTFPADLMENGVLRTGAMVSVTTGDADTAVATAVDGILTGLAGTPFATVLAAPTITITNSATGACDAVVDGAAPTGFTIPAVTTAGASAIPSWSAASGVVDESCSVDKDAADTFDSTPTVVPSWNTTAATKYNTGSLVLATGIFTVVNAGKFTVDATINYTNTGGGATSGSRTIEIFYNGATVIASNTTQPNASSAISNTISTAIDIDLAATDTVAVRFFRSNGSGTNTILATSTLSIHKFT